MKELVTTKLAAVERELKQITEEIDREKREARNRKSTTLQKALRLTNLKTERSLLQSLIEKDSEVKERL